MKEDKEDVVHVYSGMLPSHKKECGNVICSDLDVNSCEKKRSKRQRRKGKIFPSECRVPKNSKER